MCLYKSIDTSLVVLFAFLFLVGVGTFPAAVNAQYDSYSTYDYLPNGTSTSYPAVNTYPTPVASPTGGATLSTSTQTYGVTSPSTTTLTTTQGNTSNYSGISELDNQTEQELWEQAQSQYEFWSNYWAMVQEQINTHCNPHLSACFLNAQDMFNACALSYSVSPHSAMTCYSQASAVYSSCETDYMECISVVEEWVWNSLS